jgi:hypothetical protein
MNKFTINLTILFFIFIGSINTYSGEYKLVNKSGVYVSSLQFSATGINSWNSIGVNLSNDQVLTLSFDTPSENCIYNLKFTDNTGKEYEMDAVDLCGMTEIILSTTNSTEAEKVTIPKLKK